MKVLLVLLSNLVRSYEAIQVSCEDCVKVVLVLRSNLVGSCGVIQVSCEDQARVVLELRSDLTGSCKCRVWVVCELYGAHAGILLESCGALSGSCGSIPQLLP